MKKIALIGANGQLSSDILKVFDKSYFEIVPLSHADIEVTDINNSKKVLEEINPDIVINTSAYHKVDEVEENPQKAFMVNSVAQMKLAELSQEKDWVLVFLSSDYVFGRDENRKTPYKETEEAGPVNVYGVSKLAGENFTRTLCKKHFVVRVCGLFGAAGSSGKGGNFVELMIRLGKEKGEVSVVNDQILTPTYTKNIAENLNELLKTDSYGLYHMTSEGQCSWHEFAKEIFAQTKMNVKCKAVDSNFFKTRAKRPQFSALEKYNLNKIKLNRMRDWKENLNLYLKEKGHIH